MMLRHYVTISHSSLQYDQLCREINQLAPIRYTFNGFLENCKASCFN